MLAGSTVGTDSGQDGTKQIELIRDKRINGGKIVFSCVQFAFYRVGEDNLVLNGRFFLAVQETQCLGGSIIFFEDTFFDDRVDISGRQGQAGIKAALDFGEIIAFDFDNRIDVLLGSDDDPDFAIAGAAQIFGHGLQVEHEIAVVTDILADFIDEEHDMMVMAFFVDILFDAAGKFFDGDAIGLDGFLTPVPCRFFRHDPHINQDIDNIVLDEVEFMSRIFPRFATGSGKFLFEFVVAAFFRQIAFQVGYIGNRATESLHFVEDFEEYVDDGVLVLFAIGVALGVDIKKDDICRRFGGQFHIGQHHRIFDFMIIDEVVNGSLTTDFGIIQQIRKDF